VDAPPTPTFADALRGQQVLDAVRASAREDGRWLAVDPSARQPA
jgi:hypothetical protein